jgi:hypothetical protein
MQLELALDLVDPLPGGQSTAEGPSAAALAPYLVGALDVCPHASAMQLPMIMGGMRGGSGYPLPGRPGEVPLSVKVERGGALRHRFTQQEEAQVRVPAGIPVFAYVGWASRSDGSLIKHAQCDHTHNAAGHPAFLAV